MIKLELYMDMPKTCADCTFGIITDLCFFCAADRNIDNHVIEKCMYRGWRACSCPLIETEDESD